MVLQTTDSKYLKNICDVKPLREAIASNPKWFFCLLSCLSKADQTLTIPGYWIRQYPISLLNERLGLLKLVPTFSLSYVKDSTVALMVSEIGCYGCFCNLFHLPNLIRI